MTRKEEIENRRQALMALLSYDPLTGDFTWLENRGNKIRAGNKAGSVNAKGRRMIETGGRGYLDSRLAWLFMTGEWPVLQVDHIDTDPLNNRWENLRLATNQKNKQNMRKARKDSRTGVLGVRIMGRRFNATITLPSGKDKSLGGFATLEAASAAYLNAKRIYHEGCTL